MDHNNTLKLKSEAGTDSIDFKLLVIHKPGAPGIPIISELNNECCRVDWTPPVELGGCEVQGYIVERKKTASSRWIRLNSQLITFHNHLARRMVEGTAYQVRVTAVNEVGVGEPSPVSESFTPMAPTSEIPSIRKGLTTDESIELKWAAPEDQGALGMKGYLIQLQVLKNPSSENPLMELEDDAWEDWKKTKVAPDANSQVLDGLETGKTYMFRMAAENPAGRSKWTTFGPIVCAEAMEDPRINLPRPLTRLVKIRCGEKLHFQVPFVGRPKPLVSWTKVDSLPEEGVTTLPEGLEENPLGDHVTVRESPGLAVLHIRNTDRSDTGCYKMRMAVGDKEAIAVIRVAIVEPPSKPRALKIVETIGTSVQLEWEAPKDDGNSEIFAYSVEKRDKRSGPDGQWFIVYEKIRHCKCSIDDLIVGNEFQFRVRAQNEVGISEGIATKEFAKIEKETLTYTKPEYKSRDISQPPSFTLPLNNRKLTVGYTGTISCSVRGHPKPKIRWFKNKIEIIDNPKYKTTASMGVVQLEIRRPRAQDQGTYTCLAYNEHGEVSCDAQVMVREPK